MAFCLLFCRSSIAQQDPRFSQYMFNMMGINPAYAGSREILSVTSIYRSQWARIDGGPVSEIITGDCAVANKKVGLGVQVFHDEIGIMKTTGLNATYAYRLRFRKGTLAMGLQGGFTVFKANYSAVLLSGNPYDPAFSQNVNEFLPNIGAGLFYHTDKFYAGLSSPNLLTKRRSSYRDGVSVNSVERRANLFLAMGYVFKLSHNLSLKPSLLVMAVSGAPLNLDLNANLWFYNIVSLGLSVRTSDMVVGLLEIQINRQLRFGYAYDYAYSTLNASSHELMLRYEFGFEKKRVVSPRYF